jgi:hypothetical protein
MSQVMDRHWPSHSSSARLKRSRAPQQCAYVRPARRVKEAARTALDPADCILAVLDRMDGDTGTVRTTAMQSRRWRLLRGRDCGMLGCPEQIRTARPRRPRSC